MTPEQKAAFIIAQAALLNAEIAALQAEVAAAAVLGEVPRADERAFREIIAKYEGVLGHNAVIGFFGEGT